MATIRAKFRVIEVKKVLGSRNVPDTEAKLGSRWEEAPIDAVVLTPVTATAEDDENRVFWAATPSGRLEMMMTNPDAAGLFTVGETFYVDFTPADGWPRVDPELSTNYGGQASPRADTDSADPPDVAEW